MCVFHEQHSIQGLSADSGVRLRAQQRMLTLKGAIAACALSLLQAKFRGYFVPPRPEKNAVEGQRMSDGFVEERRASLQKYLQKLAAHPVIGPSEVCVRAAAFVPHTSTQHAQELCRRWNPQQPARAHMSVCAAVPHTHGTTTHPPCACTCAGAEGVP